MVFLELKPNNPAIHKSINPSSCGMTVEKFNIKISKKEKIMTGSRCRHKKRKNGIWHGLARRTGFAIMFLMLGATSSLNAGGVDTSKYFTKTQLPDPAIKSSPVCGWQDSEGAAVIWQQDGFYLLKGGAGKWLNIPWVSQGHPPAIDKLVL